MVLNYYGETVNPAQIVTLIYGYPNPTFTGSTQQIQYALSVGGVRSNLVGPFSYQDIMSQIAANHPILVDYLGSFEGHVVVLYGYDSSNHTVFINDPVYGAFQVSYGTSFVYMPQNSSPLVWSSSITTSK
jgi:hypothetical protein